MANELQLSYPDDIIIREVITELFHFGILTPKDYVKFMARTVNESATFVFGELMDYLEKMEETENDKT